MTFINNNNNNFSVNDQHPQSRYYYTTELAFVVEDEDKDYRHNDDASARELRELKPTPRLL